MRIYRAKLINDIVNNNVDKSNSIFNSYIYANSGKKKELHDMLDMLNDKIIDIKKYIMSMENNLSEKNQKTELTTQQKQQLTIKAKYCIGEYNQIARLLRDSGFEVNTFYSESTFPTQNLKLEIIEKQTGLYF